MVLKQAVPSRSLRTRGFKVKHALQICLFLSISIWLLYQVRQQSYFRNDVSDPSSFPNLTEKVRRENTIIKFGRKDLNPMLRDHELESSRKLKKEEETEIDDTKVEEINAGEDEIDGNDQERDEEEEDSDSELEDLIDEEDREKEEATVVEEENVENFQMKKHVNDDVSTRNKDENVSLRIVEEDVSFSEKKSVKIRDSIDRDAD